MKKILTIVFTVIIAVNANAQSGAAINSSGLAADPSAILDVSSTTSGILIPRMTEAQKNSITLPATGLMIYQTDAVTGFWYYDGTSWVQSIGQTGPAGATGATGFLSSGSAAGNTPYWDGSQWVVNSSNIFNNGGSVGIGTSSPDASAAIDIYSTSKGALIPRMTTSEKFAVANPAEGLQIFNTTTKCIELYANSKWQSISCAFNCGNPLIDQRDGQIYSTVQIGTQCWMSQNLNYGTYVTVSTGQAAAGVQKYCYNNNTNTCITAGGLYEWAEVMQGSSSCNGTGSPQPACSVPVQGVCPPGWHIPSHYEFTLLEKSVGSNPAAFPYDVTTSGWLGTDEGTNLKSGGSSGFKGIFAGYSFSGSFYFWNTSGRFWSSTEHSPYGAWSRYLEDSPANVYRYYDDKVAGFSVRCLKD